MSSETPLPVPSRSDSKKPLLADNVYAWLKNVSFVILPALAVLFLGFGELFDLEWPAKAAATCGLLATFVGALLKIGEKSYDNSDASNNVGVINVVRDQDGTVYQLDLGDTDPEVIDRSGKVVFNVNPNPMPDKVDQAPVEGTAGA